MRAANRRTGRRSASVGTHLVVGFGLCVVTMGALLVMSTRATVDRGHERARDRLDSAAETSARGYSAVSDTADQISGFALSAGIASLDPVACGATLSALGDTADAARL